MQLDPENLYTMPTIMGPLYRRDEGRHHFRQITSYGLQYATERDAVQRLLPRGCVAAEEPKLTIMFGYYDGVDFMAGGGYREVIVQVSARFDGEQDNVAGEFVLAMFLDDALPIIYGREQMGIPKLPGTISEAKIREDGAIRCELSLWGHLLMAVSLDPLSDQIAPVRMWTTHEINKRPWLCWKYIPSLEGPPDADYAVMIVNEMKLDKLSVAHAAQLHIGGADASDISVFRPLLDALATLVPLGPVQGVRMQGANVMRGDLSRRLR